MLMEQDSRPEQEQEEASVVGGYQGVQNYLDPLESRPVVREDTSWQLHHLVLLAFVKMVLHYSILVAACSAVVEEQTDLVAL